MTVRRLVTDANAPRPRARSGERRRSAAPRSAPQRPLTPADTRSPVQIVRIYERAPDGSAVVHCIGGREGIHALLRALRDSA